MSRRSRSSGDGSPDRRRDLAGGHPDAQRITAADLLRIADASAATRVRRRLLEAERAELVRLYADRDIDDEVLRRVQRQLDMEELALVR